MKLILDIDHDLVFDAEIASPGTEKIRVKAGSEASVTAVKADSNNYADRSRSLRDRLTDDGVLVPHLRAPARLIFARDFVFDSPGAAAEVILGRNLSARTRWLESVSRQSLFELFGASR